MIAQRISRVSESRWVKHLGSLQTRLNVEFGPAPGHLHTPSEWDTGPRRLDEHLLYFFAQRTAYAEVDGKSFLCPRGSCCWMTPEATYRFFSDQSPLIWRFRFSLTLAPKARLVAPDQNYYFAPATPGMAETVNAVLAELTLHDRWQPATLRSLLLQLSVLFFRRSTPGQKRRTLTVQQQATIAALLQNTRPDQRLKPRDLANSAALSPDYFSRVFHRTHGLSPRQWLVRQRLSYALVLLQETPLRVGEIAQRLGYANLHLFSLQFRACFGRSPKFFRQ